MTQFTLSPAAGKSLRTVAVIRAISLGCVVLFVSLLLPMIRSGQYQIDLHNGYNFIFAGLMFLLILFPGLKSADEILSSYKITITDDSIIQEHSRQPAKTIPFSEVQCIIRDANGKYMIKDNSKLNAIIVPAHIGNEEIMQKMLSEIKPITVLPGNTRWRILQYVVFIALIAPIYAAFATDDKYVTTLLGLVAFGVMAYSFYSILRNAKLGDIKWVYLILLGVSALALVFRITHQWMA